MLLAIILPRAVLSAAQYIALHLLTHEYYVVCFVCSDFKEKSFIYTQYKPKRGIIV